MAEEMPVKMLEKDHRKVEELFSECRSKSDPQEKAQIIQKIAKELEVHAEIEEQYFYPAVEKVSEEGRQMISHSRQEHEEMKNILTDLKGINEVSEEDEEKFNKLESAVMDHVKEEEAKVFPFAEDNIKDELGLGLSAKMLTLKEKLKMQK